MNRARDSIATLHHAYHRPNPNGSKKLLRLSAFHDFGPQHGKMTIAQAAEKFGISKTAMYYRLKTGKPMEKLTQAGHLNNGRKHHKDRKPAYSLVGGFGGFSGVGLGIQLFRWYGETVPTWQKIQRDTGCSRAQAYRIVRTYKDALGLP